MFTSFSITLYSKLFVKYTYEISVMPDLNNIINTGIYFIRKYKNGPSEINNTDGICTHNCTLICAGSPEVGTCNQILIPDDLNVMFKRHINHEWKKITFL